MMFTFVLRTAQLSASLLAALQHGTDDSMQQTIFLGMHRFKTTLFRSRPIASLCLYSERQLCFHHSFDSSEQVLSGMMEI